jgi:hypothetical protein
LILSFSYYTFPSISFLFCSFLPSMGLIYAAPSKKKEMSTGSKGMPGGGSSGGGGGGGGSGGGGGGMMGTLRRKAKEGYKAAGRVILGIDKETQERIDQNDAKYKSWKDSQTKMRKDASPKALEEARQYVLQKKKQAAAELAAEQKAAETGGRSSSKKAKESSNSSSKGSSSSSGKSSSSSGSSKARQTSEEAAATKTKVRRRRDGSISVRVGESLPGTKLKIETSVNKEASTRSALKSTTADMDAAKEIRTREFYAKQRAEKEKAAASDPAVVKKDAALPVHMRSLHNRSDSSRNLVYAEPSKKSKGKKEKRRPTLDASDVDEKRGLAKVFESVGDAILGPRAEQILADRVKEASKAKQASARAEAEFEKNGR